MIVRNWLAAAVMIFGLIGSVQPCYSESAPELAFSLTSMLESKYVSEGRNNLDDGGIYSFEVTAAWQQLTFGVSYLTAGSVTYDELNLSVEYGIELGPVEAYIGYTRLEFLEDDESDNEIGGGIALTGIPYIVPALDYTHSTDADGGFLELSMSTEIELWDGVLTLGPYILEGFDFGYASSGHDGPNHFQAGIDIALALTDNVSIVGYAAHSWAHKDVENDGLGDESWAGIGLSAEL